MADVSENEDSESEEQFNEEMKKKVTYTHQTRELFNKAKKQKVEAEKEDGSDEEEQDVDSDRDSLNQDDLEEEEYFRKFIESKKKKEIESKKQDEEEEEEEDDFARQLRLEKEEELRKKNEAKKTKIDPDGTEYEWDAKVGGWFPKLPDDKFIDYHKTYGTVATSASNTAATLLNTNKPLENTYYLYNGSFFKFDHSTNKWVPPETSAIYSYVDYLTGIAYDWDQEANKWQPKNNQEIINKTAANGATGATPAKKEKDNKDKTAKKKEAGWFDVNEDKNTNVYVSGLPLDTTDDEFEEMMAKYGIITKDPLTHKLKIKLYKENDEVKGDGRCCYLMPESVKLCLDLLDGSTYKGHKIKVEKAKFEMKGAYDAKKAQQNPEIHKKKLNKNKEKKLLQQQRQKLLDWEERPEIVRQKHEKVVVIKNIFTPSDLNKDPNLSKKMEEDLRAELETYGSIKKIIVHPFNPEGVVTVSFKDVEMADTCCEYLDNRVWKNGRIIQCKTWDGETKYDMEESEEDRQKRIEEWHKFLESDD